MNFLNLLLITIFWLCSCSCMAPGDNPYTILGIEQHATLAVIKKAYYKLSLNYHPDKNPNNMQALAKFQQVAAAYEILSDAEKRRNYDLFGSISTINSFTTAQSDQDLAAELEKMKQKLQKENEAQIKKMIEKAIDDFRNMQKEKAQLKRKELERINTSLEDIEIALESAGLSSTKIETAVQEYAAKLGKKSVPPSSAPSSDNPKTTEPQAPQVQKICNAFEQFLENKKDILKFKPEAEIEKILAEILPNDIVDAADKYLSFGDIIKSYAQTWQQKLAQVENTTLIIISDFIRQLFMKANVTTHNQLKSWIESEFVINFTLKKQLIALNLIAQEKPVSNPSEKNTTNTPDEKKFTQAAAPQSVSPEEIKKREWFIRALIAHTKNVPNIEKKYLYKIINKQFSSEQIVYFTLQTAFDSQFLTHQIDFSSDLKNDAKKAIKKYFKVLLTRSNTDKEIKQLIEFLEQNNFFADYELDNEAQSQITLLRNRIQKANVPQKSSLDESLLTVQINLVDLKNKLKVLLDSLTTLKSKFKS